MATTVMYAIFTSDSFLRWPFGGDAYGEQAPGCSEVSREHLHHPQHRLVHVPAQQLLVVDHAVDGLLRPAAPDHAVRARADDVEDDGALLVFVDHGLAVLVAVAVTVVDAVDVEGLADVRVIVDEQIRYTSCRADVAPRLEFPADRAFEVVLEERIVIESRIPRRE